MPVRSSVLRLPRAVRAEIEAWIVERGYGGYAGPARHLREQGHDVSRSALQRHGQHLQRDAATQRDIDDVRHAADAARALAEEVAADAGVDISEATIRLYQTRLYTAIRTSRDASIGEISEGARASANLARARVAVSRDARDAKREAAQTAAREASRQGLSAEGVAAIRAAVLGDDGP